MKPRIFPFLAACLILGTAAHAADPLPAVLDVLKEENARLERFTLPNGGVCLLKEDRSAPVVSIQIWFGTGAIHEQEHLGSGLSHAIEHMIFKGTETRGPGDLTKAIDDAGGQINAYTSFDRTVFHTDLPARNWRIGLDVLVDAVANASFPSDEWDREREVIRREIAMGRDDPGRVLSKLLWRTAYRVHPYRFPVIGHEDLFVGLTRDDLHSFSRRHYVTDNMIVVVVGAVDSKAVREALHDTVGAIPRRTRTHVVLPPEPPQLTPRFARERGHYRLARLEWAYHSVRLNDSDAPALDVLAQVVGQGRSSRLNREIRERMKLVNSISAWSYTPREPGLFGISASFAPDDEKAVIAAIEEEVARWRTSRFPRAEIEKARRMLLTSELSDLQSMKGQATSFASGEFYAGSPSFASTYLARVAAVGAKELREVAEKYLRPEKQTLVILSPEEAEEEARDDAPTATRIVVHKRILPSGVPLLVREDHRLPFVYFCVALRGGLLSENVTNNGITQLMSDLLVRGTRKRSRERIATTIDRMGASLSPFAGYNSFGMQGKCLSTDTDAFCELLADCLLNPVFDDEEVERQRALQVAAIDQQHERPFFLAQKALREVLFPGHPYQWHPQGTRERVEALDRDAILDHFQRLVVSGNMVLAVFGDITADRAVDVVQRRFSGIPLARRPAGGPGRPTPTLPQRTEQRQPKEQAILLAGFPGVSVGDSRRDALSIVESALSGLSSDLGLSVRDERGLAYYVGAYQQVGLEPGVFVVYAGTREDAVVEVEDLMRAELARLAGGGLRQEELDRASTKIVADYEMGLQDNLSVSLTCSLDELYGLGYGYSFTTPQRFRSMTLADVQRAAASVLSMDALAISAVLPEAREEEPDDGRQDTGTDQ